MGFMFPNDEGGVPTELCPPCFHLNPNMRYLLFKKTESQNHQYTVYSKLKQLKTTNVKKKNSICGDSLRLHSARAGNSCRVVVLRENLYTFSL